MKSFLKLFLTFLVLLSATLQADDVKKCEDKYNKCISKCDDIEADDSCYAKCEQKLDKCAPNREESEKEAEEAEEK